MNRDEQLSRTAALPPSIHRRGPWNAIYPHELSGGTWIGINEMGMTAALINWYSQPQRKETLSRGIVIPALLSTSSPAEAEQVLRALPASRLNPFRLMLIFQPESRLEEWRSNGTQLRRNSVPWQTRHWFSSGFDETKANEIRLHTCQGAEREADAGTGAWLRRLHRSHHPTRGAFSICMHRAAACTVSCTEIVANETSASLFYHAGPPCEPGPRFKKSISFKVKDLQAIP